MPVKYRIIAAALALLPAFQSCTPLSDCFSCTVSYQNYEWTTVNRERDSSYTEHKEFCNVDRSVISDFIESNRDTIVIERHFPGAAAPYPDKFAKRADCSRFVKKK